MQSVLYSGSVESKKAEYPSNTSLMSEQRSVDNFFYSLTSDIRKIEPRTTLREQHVESCLTVASDFMQKEFKVKSSF